MDAGGATQAHEGQDVDDLLGRAARGDLGAYGEFVDETTPEAWELALLMRCDDPETALRRCYVRSWDELGDFTAGDLRARAWLLARVRDALRPDGHQVPQKVW